MLIDREIGSRNAGTPRDESTADGVSLSPEYIPYQFKPIGLKITEITNREIERRPLHSFEDLQHSYDTSFQSLSPRLSPEGIEASGENDQFFGLFGRDTVYVFGEIRETFGLIKGIQRQIVLNGNGTVNMDSSLVRQQLKKVVSDQDEFFARGVKGFLHINQYQADVDDYNTSRQVGKPAHEVREHVTAKMYKDLVSDKLALGGKPFYTQFTDEQLDVIKAHGKNPQTIDLLRDPIIPLSEVKIINWNTADAAPLRVSETVKALKLLRQIKADSNKIPMSALLQESLELLEIEVRSSKFRDLVEWCRKNTKEFGFAGWKFDPDNKAYVDFPNQGLLDSERPHEHDDPEMNKREDLHPKKPADLQAFSWAAKMHAADVYDEFDPEYAKVLREEAKDQKKRFNKSESEGGYLMRDPVTRLVIPAEAIDGRGRQIKIPMSGGSFSAFGGDYNGNHIIDEEHRDDLVDFTMNPTMFDPHNGMRTYANTLSDKNLDRVSYQKSPNNYWPILTSGAAIGIGKWGYNTEKEELLDAMLEGTYSFAQLPTNHPDFAQAIENYNVKDGRREMFRNPNGQTSGRDQSWSSAAIMYASTWMLWNRHGTLPGIEDIKKENPSSTFDWFPLAQEAAVVYI